MLVAAVVVVNVSLNVTKAVDSALLLALPYDMQNLLCESSLATRSLACIQDAIWSSTRVGC